MNANKNSNANEKNLLWMDLEMSGLDPSRDVILEVSAVVTNENLDILDKGIDLVVYQEESVFSRMDDWNQKQHTSSGLWNQVRESKLSIGEVEHKILDYIKQYTVSQKTVLCGNSIWQDRRFIRKYMPQLDRYLHYRMIDVSTVKELVKRWYNGQFEKTEQNHRALEDILQSIEELKYYRQNFFHK